MTLHQENPAEVVLWKKYKQLETVKANLWIIALAAFRDYVRTQDESEWQAYERIIDKVDEIRAELESARHKWKLECMRAHNFPMHEEDASHLADQLA